MPDIGQANPGRSYRMSVIHCQLIWPLRSGGLARRVAAVHTAAVDRSAVARVVLDTNVFVAAGINLVSHSAWLVDAVRDGRLRMVWDSAIRAEIEHVIRQIPRLSWTHIADLFRAEDRFGGSTHPEACAAPGLCEPCCV